VPARARLAAEGILTRFEDGMRVAITRCMTRIDPVLPARRELIRGSLPRVPFATVRPRPPGGDSFDSLRVGTPTRPPTSPPHARRWADSASRRSRSSSSALTLPIRGSRSRRRDELSKRSTDVSREIQSVRKHTMCVNLIERGLTSHSSARSSSLTRGTNLVSGA
jgi:hypothetical protein